MATGKGHQLSWSTVEPQMGGHGLPGWWARSPACTRVIHKNLRQRSTTNAAPPVFAAHRNRRNTLHCRVCRAPAAGAPSCAPSARGWLFGTTSSMRTWGCAAPPLACSTQRRVAAHQPSTTCLLLRHSRTLRAPPSWPPVSSLRAMPQRNGDNPQLEQPSQEQASVDRSDAEVPCLVVFDLDACLWLPEMYQLDHPPGQWDEKAAGVRAGKQVCATPSPLALKHLLSPLVFTSRLCASSRGPSTRSRRWQRSRGFATQRWPSPPAQQGRPLRTL